MPSLVEIIIKARDEASATLSKVKGSVGGLGGTVQKYSGQIKAAGAAMTAMGGAGLLLVDRAKEINAVLGQTALTTGIAESALRKMALSISSVDSPIAEVVASMDLLARSGIRDEASLKKATAAFDELGDAVGGGAVVDQMIMTMKTYGLSVDEAAASTDKITYLLKNSALSMDDFGSIIGYITPELVDMGLSLSDTIALMGIMESKGVSGGVATRAFRKAITEATTEGISLAEALGVTQGELAAYNQQLLTSTGYTAKYAEEANKQYSLMDKMKYQWSKLTYQAGTFLEPMEPIFALMTAMGPVMIAMTYATKAAAAAQWLLNAAMWASPYVLVIVAIAAIAAGIYLLIKHWDKVTAFFSTVWRKVTDIFKRYWQWILLIIFPAGGVIALFIKYWGPITGFFKDIWDGIAGIFKSVWDGIVDGIKLAVNSVIGIFNAMINFISDKKLFSIKIPSWVPLIGGNKFELKLPKLPNIPTMDTGGLVKGPGLFAVGAGVKEIVRTDRGGGGINITLQFNDLAVFDREESIRNLADKVGQAIDRKLRLNYGSVR